MKRINISRVDWFRYHIDIFLDPVADAEIYNMGYRATFKDTNKADPYFVRLFDDTGRTSKYFQSKYDEMWTGIENQNESDDVPI